MEKFCLKWNDFQTTVSHSFSLLRKEKELFDVTLVSDDDVQISAHKLVLSASSSFFKSILRKNSHPQPFIYLSGINSTNLGFVLDYIYQGEVQIFQQQLDTFLDVAQKLKVSGLISIDNDNVEGEREKSSQVLDDHNDKFTEKKYNETEHIADETRVETYKIGEKKVRYNLVSQNEMEIKSKVKELISRKEGQFTCTACGKSGNDERNMLRHIETHIHGVSYDCNICDKSFRSKNSLGCHTSIFHKRT